METTAQITPSVEACNADLPLRSRTEIILKFVAVHVSTLVLVNEFGSSLGMPFQARVWLVIRAAFLPLWSTVALALQLLAVIATCLQDWLEEGPSSMTFLVSRAIGMYSTAELNVHDDDQLRIAHRLPQHIPLSEAFCFFYRRAFTPDGPIADISVNIRPRKRMGERRASRILAIILTLIYLVQAVATTILVIRRARLELLLPDGAPFIDTDPAIAVTPFELQAMLLALYGILVAVILIALQIAHLEWVHIDDGRQWTYSADPVWSSIRRSIVGLCGALMFYDMVGRSFHIEGFEGLSRAFSSATYPVISAFYRNPILSLSFILVVLAATRLKWRRIIPRVQKMLTWMASSVLRKNISARTVSLLTLGIFNTMDYARQDFTEYHLIRGIDSQGDTPSNSSSRSRSIFVHVYQSIYIFFAISALISLFALHRSIFEKAEGPSIPVPSELFGCRFEPEFKAWMWKDPLAERLWAF